MEELVIATLRSVDSETTKGLGEAAAIMVGIFGIRAMWVQGSVASQLLTAWMTAAHKLVCTLPVGGHYTDKLGNMQKKLAEGKLGQAMICATGLCSDLRYWRYVLRQKLLDGAALGDDDYRKAGFDAPDDAAQVTDPPSDADEAMGDVPEQSEEPIGQVRVFGNLVYVHGRFKTVDWEQEPQTSNWLDLKHANCAGQGNFMDTDGNNFCYKFYDGKKLVGMCRSLEIPKASAKDVEVLKYVDRADGQYVITREGYAKMSDEQQLTARGEINAYWPTDKDKIMERLFLGDGDREAEQLLKCTRCFFAFGGQKQQAAEAAYQMLKEVNGEESAVESRREGWNALQEMAEAGVAGSMGGIPNWLVGAFQKQFPQSPIVQVVFGAVWKFFSQARLSGDKLRWLLEELTLRSGVHRVTIGRDVVVDVTAELEKPQLTQETLTLPGTLYEGEIYEELVKFHAPEDVQIKWPVKCNESNEFMFTAEETTPLGITAFQSTDPFVLLRSTADAPKNDASSMSIDELEIVGCGDHNAVCFGENRLGVPQDKWFKLQFPLSSLAHTGSRPHFTREMQGGTVEWGGEKVAVESVEPVVGGKVKLADKEPIQNPPASGLTRSYDFVPSKGRTLKGVRKEIVSGTTYYVGRDFVFSLVPYTELVPGQRTEHDGQQWEVLELGPKTMTLARFWFDLHTDVLSKSALSLSMMRDVRKMMYIPAVEIRDVPLADVQTTPKTSHRVLYSGGGYVAVAGGVEDAASMQAVLFDDSDTAEVQRLHDQFQRAYFYDASNLVLSSMGRGEKGALDDDYVAKFRPKPKPQ